MFYKKAVLKNFAIFAGRKGKHLRWSPFLIKNFFKSTYFDEHLRTTASENVSMKLRKIKNYS